MGDTNTLVEMIKGNACVELQQLYGKHFAELKEPDTRNSCVTIRNVPADSLVIKVDNVKAPNNVFNGKKGECKCADYVIISEEKQRIIFIEMKKTKASWTDIVHQLIGAQCFMKYCQEIGRAFWKEDIFLNDYQHRFVCIAHTSIPKRPTNIERRDIAHSTPETALKIDWPHYIHFNQLAS